MSEPQLTVDTTEWPMVVLTFAGAPPVDSVRAHLAEIEDEVLSRGERFVQVVDLSRAVRPNPEQRLAIAEHQRANESRYEELCVGEAYVVPTAELMGAMTGVFFAAKPQYDYIFVATLPEALDWARNRLEG